MSLSKSIYDHVIFPLFLSFQWFSIVLKIQNSCRGLQSFTRSGPCLSHWPLPCSQFTLDTLAFTFLPVACKIFSNLAHTTWHHPHGCHCGRWGLQDCASLLTIHAEVFPCCNKRNGQTHGYGTPSTGLCMYWIFSAKALRVTPGLLYLKGVSHGLPQTPLKKHPYCLT